MFCKMAKPTRKEIKYKAGDENNCKRTKAPPPDNPNIIFFCPCCDKNNTYRHKCVDDEMKCGKSNIQRTVFCLCLFVLVVQQGNKLLNHKQEEHAGDKKTRSLEGPFFKIAEIGDQRIHNDLV